MTRLSRFLVALAATCAAGATAAQAEAVTTVAGNVAPWLSKATEIGKVPDTQQVRIVVHMALRDTAGLKQLVADVSKPSSPSYGHYLDVASFRARFAPEAADVSAVRSMLANAGLSKVEVGPGGVYVSGIATVAQLRNTFGVSQTLYKYGSLTVRANKEAPHLPAALAAKVVFIEGLDETTRRYPLHASATQGKLVAPAAAKSAVDSGVTPAVTPPPVASNAPSPYCDTYFGDLEATLSVKPKPYDKTLPWLNCGYTPQQIQAAYGMDKVNENGKGVTVAILDAFGSPTIKQDAQQYAFNHGLKPLTDANFSQIVPEGIYDVDPNAPCGPYGWWEEESLDVAAVHGSAPGATIVYVGSEDCDTSLTTALMNTIYNHTADIITNSYSYTGEFFLDPASVASQDQTLMAAATEGISVLFSSGDDGDLSQITGVASGSYQGTSPYATAVGGTTLAVHDASGTKQEWGWGTYRDYLSSALVNSGTSVSTTGLQLTSALGYTFDAFAFYSGAGGGISLIEPQPDYQAPVVPVALATTVNYSSGYQTTLPTPQRVVPDVAMDADPYTGYLIGETFTIAGDPINDSNCTPKHLNTTEEYCEIGIGGTSLASPLMAGALAIVDQHRLKTGQPLIGFANPWLYGQQIGTRLTGKGINDVKPPEHPTALLRGYETDLTRVRVVTVNSVPELVNTVPFGLFVCGVAICEGTDDVFNYTAPGYDTVTGLGVPYLPKLIKD